MIDAIYIYKKEVDI